MNNNILADFRHNDWNIDKILIFIIPLIFIAILFFMHEEWLLESLLLCTVIFFYILLIYKHRMVYGYSGIRIASIPSSIVAAFTVFISIPSIYILMIKDNPNEIQYYYSIIIFYLIFPMGLYLGKSIRMIDEVKVKKLLISKVAKSYNDKYYYEILIILFSISMLIFCGYLMRVNELPLIELIRNPGSSTRYFFMREEALKLLEMSRLEKYMFIWLRSLFIPIGIVGSLYLMLEYRKKKYNVLFILFFIVGLIINSITLEKFPIAAIFVAIGTFYLLKKDHISFRFMLLFVFLILTGPLLITYLLIIEREGIFEIIFWSYIDRLFVIPSEVLFYYFEIFPDIHPFLFGSSSQLFSWMHTEGTFPISNYVAKIWWNMPDTSGSANAVYIGNYWSDFGWYGVIISTIILGFIAHLLQWKILTVSDYKKNFLFIVSIAAAVPSFTFGFISANFTNIFFTKGLILLIFFLFIYEYMKKYFSIIKV
ncbi:MAG: O-antigen polymerase [Candidatus Neomarinimicrobiota bacterium]|nr:O-antigen polymerase [Candidatus Neomarinimicrobiota bacterium]